MSLPVDAQKRAAAFAAAREVEDGMAVGLGTGSTAAHLVDALAGRRIAAVATSRETEARARAAGFRLVDLGATLDVAIDGVDEIDGALGAIKGAGGAMLREKIVAAAATRMIAIADASKRVSRLGGRPVPVEVLPFAEQPVFAALAALGGRPVRRERADGPYRTDQGNLVLDTRFDAITPDLPAALSAIPGALGHGLFLAEIDALYLAAPDGSVTRTERGKAGAAL